jgi:peptidoglycan hydrolase FlgJ
MTPLAAINNGIDNVLQAATQQSSAAVTGAKTKSAARADAQNFEATFLSSMFQHMFTGTDGDGPVGGSPGLGVWRSFLTDEFAKSFASKGGIGLSDQVYQSLLAHQEVAARQ